jgi:ABC-2 type transport system ATP-binding protein
METLISFESVVKKYGKVTALDEISFSLDRGEIVALVGNNGCGKTTTINVLSNLLPYDGGSIKVFDRKVTPSYVLYKQNLGVLLSPPILVNEFSAYEYLRFVAKFQRVPKSNIEPRIRDLLGLFEIESTNKFKIQEHSAGDKMKIAFAASIIHNPDILVLDEPFVHIDSQTSDFIQSLLKSFVKSKTVLITSHNIDLIVGVCERILIMEKGRITSDFKKPEGHSNQMIIEMIKSKMRTFNNNIVTPDWLGSASKRD